MTTVTPATISHPTWCACDETSPRLDEVDGSVWHTHRSRTFAVEGTNATVGIQRLDIDGVPGTAAVTVFGEAEDMSTEVVIRLSTALTVVSYQLEEWIALGMPDRPELCEPGPCPPWCITDHGRMIEDDMREHGGPDLDIPKTGTAHSDPLIGRMVVMESRTEGTVSQAFITTYGDAHLTSARAREVAAWLTATADQVDAWNAGTGGEWIAERGRYEGWAE